MLVECGGGVDKGGATDVGNLGALITVTREGDTSSSGKEGGFRWLARFIYEASTQCQ